MKAAASSWRLGRPRRPRHLSARRWGSLAAPCTRSTERSMLPRVLVLLEGTTAKDGASSFVNPLTALEMLEQLVLREGHSALVHTAAASNLGQMLVKLCIKDGVPLVNIVRKPDQEELLRSLGAVHVCNWHRRRSRETSSRLSKRRPRRLRSTPRAGARSRVRFSVAWRKLRTQPRRDIHAMGRPFSEQVYIYGTVHASPTTLTRDFGMAWGVGGGGCDAVSRHRGRSHW